MIKHLITGGCSFSLGENSSGWTGELFKKLKLQNSNLTSEHTGEISQGQELIQKKVVKAITSALNNNINPEEIFVAVMYSGINRKAWYIDNPDIIEKIIEGWKKFDSGMSFQFIDIDNYKYKNGPTYFFKTYYTKCSTGDYRPEGGWYYTINGSDSAINGIKEYYLLDRRVNGVNVTHNSLENIVFLQNFCKLHKIKLVQQFYMDEVFLAIKNENTKNHQIIKYLYDQLDMSTFTNMGFFDYILSLQNFTSVEWFNLPIDQKNKINNEFDLFLPDFFHPNQKGSELYFKNILNPVIERLLND